MRALVKAYCEKLTAGACSRDFAPLMELLDDDVELVADLGPRRRGKEEVVELLSLLPADYSIEGELIGSDGIQVIVDFRSRSRAFGSVHRGVQRFKVRDGRITFIAYRA